MITTNTLFILGAGASKVFGYPSGLELKQKVYEKIKNALKEPNYFPRTQRLKGLNLEERAEGFAEKLRKTSIPSIDFFLNNHLEEKEWLLIGKHFISVIIGSIKPRIDLALNWPPDTNSVESFINSRKNESNDLWVDYIFKRMSEGANSISSFINNKVKFITFNYDYSLEIALRTAVENSYPMKDINHNTLSNFEVVHPYGLVKPNTHLLDNGEYDIKTNPDAIQLIFEPRNNAFISLITKHIEWARTIIFLGFGYHEENTNLLQTNTWGQKELDKLAGDNKPIPLFPTKKIYLSRMGMTEPEINRKVGLFSGNGVQLLKIIKSNNQFHDCYNFLRNTVDIK